MAVHHEPRDLLKIEQKLEPQVRFFRTGLGDFGDRGEMHGGDQKMPGIVDIGVFPQKDPLASLRHKAEAGLVLSAHRPGESLPSEK